MDAATGWGKTLSQLRTIIRKVDKDVTEEVKWRMPSNPTGVPVWSHNGIICVVSVLRAR
jgi:hypothetical protein